MFKSVLVGLCFLCISQTLFGFVGFEGQVSSLIDKDFGILMPFGGDAYEDEDVCVYAKSHNYSVTAWSDAPGGKFEMLSSGGSETVIYKIFWNNSKGTTGKQELVSNKPEIFQSHDNSQCNENQNDKKNSNIEFFIPASSLNGAITGSYYSTVSIQIAEAGL